MPELSNIETYEKLDGAEFQPVLKRFAKVLKNIGVWNDELEKAFSDFDWKIEGDGHVYSWINTSNFYISKFSDDVKVRPLLMVYTPALSNDFSDNWISCKLLLQASDLRDFSTGEYYPFVPGLIKGLSHELLNEFDRPIYFTDEIQDGEDFFAIAKNSRTGLWQFDYALIPSSAMEWYDAIPETHNVQMYDGYMEAFYTDRWKQKSQ